ncbi:glutathione S-transferase [Chaetomium strumarium]|uniref:Glutathione S-transferase n=1 Tax=Chaetomium strumarium TaxID=1170767 RepID=A0AAJ0H286_9PEZI|nr:glutathione S-transferase [Chaetomium strumarium]
MSAQSNLKPIKVYGKGGPNPPKVAMILQELDLPHEIIDIQFSELKKPDYLAVNPNGRIPAIYDPNTDLTLWESGAILEYLIEKYDKAQKLSFPPGSKEAYHAKQWLFFQTTGQGPYYGQGVWFNKYHPEKVQSAIERYLNEVKRVTGVIEGHLAKQKKQYGAQEGFDGPWFVGNKLSYVDFAFVPWQTVAAGYFAEALPDGLKFNPDDYPLVKEWLAKLRARKSVSSSLSLPTS